jgi:hypothetical protein
VQGGEVDASLSAPSFFMPPVGNNFSLWRASEAFPGVQENMPVRLVSVESLGKCASQQY